ncbi:MAG: Mur ligase domain-containing protein [Deltaproteobacteria bacterium]|nr:Mur ligase domain-containing protein [Deltaproteobacteria bacterium]
MLGCSGVGMHGLVNLCRDLNIELDGVDEKPCLSSDLKYLGKVCLENVSDFKYDFVSYSGAISKTNPIIRRAFDLGIPVKHRYEFLNDLLGDKKR